MAAMIQIVKLEMEMDKATNRLVTAARKTIETSELGTTNNKNQFRNFLSVAKNTNGMAKVEEWVHYQMSRIDIWKGGLGEQVLKHIDYDKQEDDDVSLHKQAEIIARSVYKKEYEDHIHEIHAMLVHRYAGYLERAYVARNVRRKKEDDN